jgi:hypothetical protein
MLLLLHQGHPQVIRLRMASRRSWLLMRQQLVPCCCWNTRHYQYLLAL